MSALLRAAGRTALSAVFITGGLKTFKAADQMAPVFENTITSWGLGSLQERAGGAENLIKASSGTMVGGGTLLALGLTPRLASTALLGALIPTTLAGHAFWEKDGEEAKKEQIQFLKNLALAGGLLSIMGTPRSRSTK